MPPAFILETQTVRISEIRQSLILIHTVSSQSFNRKDVSLKRFQKCLIIRVRFEKPAIPADR